MTTPPAATRLPAVTRAAWVAVGAILLVAFLLRAAFPSRLAVEHFDEGVYAARLWFQDDERFPFLHLYAPPLTPYLVQGSVSLLGPRGWGPMLVGIVSGTVTVGVVWWLTRCWFGPAAGLAAATLAASSDVHLLFSRTALTDPLLLMWLTAGVLLIWLSARSPRPLTIGAAGLATGLAWWTKYNGWLPLAVGLAGLLPWLARGRARGTSAIRPLAVWLAVALVAAAVWSPVGLQIERESEGGYADVARNHARYVVGIRGWWDSLTRQVSNLRALDGWPTWAGIALAVILAGAGAEGRSTWSESARRPGRWLVFVAAGACLAAVAALVGSAGVLGLRGAAGAVHAFARNRRAGDGPVDPARALGAWMLAAWFGGLFVSTPLYTPYARLVLPWLAAAWIGTGALMATFAEQLADLGASRRRTAVSGGMLATATAVLVAISMTRGLSTPAAFEDRSGLEQITGQIVGDVTAPSGRRPDDLRRPVVVYVYAEPAIVYHLASRGIVAPPTGHLGFAESGATRADVPVFLAVGPHAERSPEFVEAWRRVSGRFDVVAEYPYRPSPLVALDSAVGSGEAAGESRGRLYALRGSLPDSSPR